jgi:O-antigen/teichoic acid export membrane protein
MAGKKLIKNSIIGSIQVILTAVLTLLSVPIFIHKLGMELYGVFAIVSVIGNLNLLTNLGLNGSLLIYVARLGKCKESDHVIVVTRIIIITLTTVFSLLAIIFSDFIIRDIFSIPVQYFADSKNLLGFLVFANALLLIGETYTAIIDAQQKIYITNIIQFVYSCIYWGGMITVVLLGGQLTMIGIVALISASVWLIFVMFSAHRVWGKLEINGVLTDFKKIAKEQLSYGAKLFFSGMAGFLFIPLSKILLVNFVGINYVAFYDIASKIRGQISNIITKALYPIYPYIANAPTNEALHKKLFDFSKKIQLFVIPVFIIEMFVLTILLKLWLGSDNLEQISIYTITMSSTLIILSPPVLLIYQYLSAKEMADKNIWIQLTQVLVNVIVFFALFKTFDIYAILISDFLAYISSYILCNYYQFKYFGVKFRKQRSYYLKLIVFSIVCVATCALIRHFVPVSLLDLIIYPIIVGASFIFFVRTQNLINTDDMERYLGHSPFLKNSFTRIFIS